MYDPGPASDRLEANIFLNQLWRFVFEKLFQQPHQREDFGFRPLPVFGRERVEGQEIDFELGASLDALACGPGAFLVAFDPRQTTCPGPATISIHDDRDVPRGGLSGGRHAKGRWFGRELGRR